MPAQPKPSGGAFRDLAAISLTRSVLEITCIWLLIGCSLFLAGRIAERVSVVIACLLAFPIMTCLQQGLLTLLHDSWHGLISPRKSVNDFVGRYVLSFPCIKLWGRLKREHLDHHSYLGIRDSDPTFHLYGFRQGEARDQPVHFAFSRLGGRVMETLWRALTGRSRVEVAARESYWGAKGDLWRELLSILVMQVLLAWVLSRIAPWWAYLAFWCIPLFTSTALCNLIRTFAEHSNPLSDNVPPGARLISFESNWLELAFIAPLHFNYHAEHHQYMWVPHYRLPEVRKRLAAAGPMGFSLRTSYLEIVRGHFFRRTSASEI